MPGNRAGDDELAVRRDVDVVDAAFGADALHARQRRRVDDVDRAGAGDDRDVDALAVLADRDVVRVIGQRDVLGHRQRLRVGDVERRLGLVGDVELLPSGATAAPWFTSIPLISPTTLLVAGSISITLSPAALVWTMRTVAAPQGQRARPAKTPGSEKVWSS